VLDEASMVQLANLCHDCRACFHACMYAPPHEFDLNPPKILTAIREETYRRYVPRLSGRRVMGLAGASLAAAALAVLLAMLVGVIRGSGALWGGSGAHSAYQVLPYTALLVLATVPLLFGVVIALIGAARYWREVAGPLTRLLDVDAVSRALWYAARLRYLRGGGDECYYPADRPRASRRRLHALTAYGFGAAFVSTVAAAIEQHIAGIAPPYPYASLPVVSGLVGGVAITIGCTGLLIEKRHSDKTLTTPEMLRSDVAFIVTLDVLAVTGMLVLFLRGTPAFGLLLIVHVACVAVSFALFPYTKFIHFVYRFLAIVADNLETET
jgi:citrate/tricarballylate utilization protein